ncbi:ubiquinone/menaquinone biosynthesis C-methylase UbiE [Microbacterium ginsengiterrae]|uniref:Ubiquinone/menaquinone biosynthesis C-methylase UbiE n=1 Tax=Microbacterium ginsengiterrae TaxID=546115 RepID=A0A7W9CCT9_9MICO|nr:class I SAM-dependent methyltransferase [Microbacterium ginsengiterrae]MBB5743236.1 ubiquinone/menaquinone biosynthesis C-methylase UbiE [Microbacterium ginsengiterrae]
MDQAERDQWIQDYYARRFAESDRLTTRSANGQIEFLRVQQLVSSRLRESSRVLDVGGATGVHARWLAADGHSVTLIDPVPEQVAAAATHIPDARALVGDARDLQVEDGSVDAVLLLGPLYHLQDRADRRRAWREAYRVLVPGGLVFGAGISRAAAALKIVLARSFHDLPANALLALLEDGTDVRAIPTEGFPGGHHHSAAELTDEAVAAGFTGVTTVGIEGPAGLGLEMLPPEDSLVSAGLTIADAATAAPPIADLSPHLLAIGTRPT